LLGNFKSDPPDAPTSLHGFLVGYDILFQDDFEDDKGWTAGLPGDDASTGVWERCDPEGTEAQAEDDHTPSPGVMAYITQCAAGSSQGTYDIDGGQTTLESPVFDLSGETDAAVTYYRWYSNDTGDNPGEDYWVVQVTDDGWASTVTLENTNVSRREWSEMQFYLNDYIDLTSQVQFRFRASDENNGSLVEAGLDDFKIITCARNPDAEPPTVEVLDPNGGEELIGGQPYDIQWNSSDNVGVTMTTILWSTDGGATYPTEIASGPALTSPFTWDVPDVGEPTCRIKIVAQDGALNTGLDESDGDFEITLSTGVADQGGLPPALVLRQNLPNPFNPVTEIEFGLPSAQTIALEVYDVSGRLVSTLASGTYSAGYHSAVWRGTDDHGTEVSTGVYFYRLVTEEKVLTKKMLMLK
jgi:hypothetical protein